MGSVCKLHICKRALRQLIPIHFAIFLSKTFYVNPYTPLVLLVLKQFTRTNVICVYQVVLKEVVLAFVIHYNLRPSEHVYVVFNGKPQYIYMYVYIVLSMVRSHMHL